ncbi:MAG: hypothetical protein GY714_29440 [Desulfobacterales bacterium]|nr:hypothetical protein [Desulfobacterales bacterium]MCP4162228.1 hypothetical protein [Deltaproteobacteria bacterium]
MAKKSKSADQLDKMMKAFVDLYDIPSKEEIQRLMKRLDKVEKAINKSGLTTASPKSAKAKVSMRRGRKPGPKPGKKPGRKKIPVDSKESASGVVLDAIKLARRGADFSRIKKKTGYEDKKLRNIIFRLKKNKMIKPLRRGVYVAT